MKWTLEKLQQEASKYKTLGEFQKYSGPAYKSAWRQGFLNKVCSHMDKVLCHHTKESIQIEALKYKNRTEFKNTNPGSYRAAIRMGIIDNVCLHMECVYVRWTNSALHKEALRYLSVSEFKEKSNSAYCIAAKRGILSDICFHMERDHISWTTNLLQTEALKYKTRGEFQKNSSAYLVALRRGILDQICKHMKLSRSSSIAEKELFDLIKSFLPSTKKIRDMKVCINNKPYIIGFEIDIFVPEFMKGIEFDGKRYHSFEFMRKDISKNKWSDDDIHGYHQLKDDWFATKSIQILHIREEDWIKDKESCIQKCLTFLGVE